MGLVVVLALLRPDPELLVGDSSCIVAEFVVPLEVRYDLEQVDRRVIPSRLSPRVRQEPFVIELLHVLHRLLRGDTQLPRDELLGFHCVQRVRSLSEFLAFLNREDCRGLGFLNHFEQDHGGKFVKEPVALPQEGRLLVLLASLLILEVDLPEFLRRELFDLLVSIDDEAQGWELTWAVADDALTLGDVTQEQSLKTRE